MSMCEQNEITHCVLIKLLKVITLGELKEITYCVIIKLFKDEINGPEIS